MNSICVLVYNKPGTFSLCIVSCNCYSSAFSPNDDQLFVSHQAEQELSRYFYSYSVEHDPLLFSAFCQYSTRKRTVNSLAIVCFGGEIRVIIRGNDSVGQ